MADGGTPLVKPDLKKLGLRGCRNGLWLNLNNHQSILFNILKQYVMYSTGQVPASTIEPPTTNFV